MQIATLLGTYCSPDGLAVMLVAAALVGLASIGARRIGEREPVRN